MLLLKTRYRKIHLVGIGGAGMSGIAELLHNMGFVVSGSDIARKETTLRLENLGIEVFYGHDAKHVEGKDVVVYSSAIGMDNPELMRAYEIGIPVIPRAEMLAEIMRVKFSIAVSGSHGKTTTTSMIGYILKQLDPTIVVGGILKGVESGAKIGNSDFIVVEADESDRSFLKLLPSIAVITNIDEEHLDTYANLIDIKKAFLEFANSVPFYGSVVLNVDDRNTRDIIPFVEKNLITYGILENARIQARNVELRGLSSRYDLFVDGRFVSEVELNVPGMHNVSNSLAGLSVAYEMGLDMKACIENLKEFSGVRRRFEIKGKYGTSIIVDDYGHHPKEIEQVLLTARHFYDGKIVVVFQPHRYTRTKFLWKDFAKVLLLADEVILLPIYPAGEKPIKGVSSELIAKAMQSLGGDPKLMDKEQALDHLKRYLNEPALIITLGAGDVFKLGDMLIHGVQKA